MAMTSVANDRSIEFEDFKLSLRQEGENPYQINIIINLQYNVHLI